jgi:hypothetical protein
MKNLSLRPNRRLACGHWRMQYGGADRGRHFIPPTGQNSAHGLEQLEQICLRRKGTADPGNGGCDGQQWHAGRRLSTGYGADLVQCRSGEARRGDAESLQVIFRFAIIGIEVATLPGPDAGKLPRKDGSFEVLNSRTQGHVPPRFRLAQGSAPFALAGIHSLRSPEARRRPQRRTPPKRNASPEQCSPWQSAPRSPKGDYKS